MIEFRPYQSESIEAVLRELATHRSTLLVLPTGTGKTIVFAEVAKRCRRIGRILVLAHREELLHQAVTKIEAAGLTAAIEQADQRVAPLFMPDVIVASVATLARPARREAFAPEAFALVVVDEAHHAIASSYLAILRYFTSARILGVTATPDRGDGSMLAKVFQSVAYQYEIRDAIDDGYLSPIVQHTVDVEGLDLRQVKTTYGDFEVGALSRVLEQEGNLHGVAAPLVELAGDRQTLVFASSVAHAQALVQVLERYAPGRSIALDGSADSEHRRAVLEAFSRGDYQYLVNCALFTEGFDCPSISCVAVARPTQSRALYTQMIGRGTRLAPGKSDLLVLDFAGNAGKHSLVCPSDILGGNEPPEVLARAKKLLLEKPEQLVHEAIDQARDQIAVEERKRVLAQARYRATAVDPFQVLRCAPKRTAYANLPASEKQREILERFKVAGLPEHFSRGQASALIGRLIERSRAGLCTYKQAHLLSKHGVDSEGITFEKAREIIDALASNGWRLPAQYRQGIPE
ncbi:MAG: DEAD/DEAH box helicase [Pseudomonadota bacterium]